MLPAEALDAIRRGRPGVHLSWQGQVLEAKELVPNGNSLFIRTVYLNGDPGPTVPANQASALKREYEERE